MEKHNEGYDPTTPYPSTGPVMTQIPKTGACMLASFALTALILHVVAQAPHRAPDAGRHHSSFYPASPAEPAAHGSGVVRCVSGGAGRGFLVHDMRMWLHLDRDGKCR